MLTWAIVFVLRGQNVSGDAGCVLGVAMVCDVVIAVSVAVAWAIAGRL